MTKSELIECITEKQNQLTIKDVEVSVKLLLDYMSDILASGERIEIRVSVVFPSITALLASAEIQKLERLLSSKVNMFPILNLAKKCVIG
jgi:hypothetical protein